MWYHRSLEIKKKEGNPIILITQDECFKLQKLGYTFGDCGVLHKTHSNRPPKYYLTQEARALSDLRKIRESRIAK